MLVASLPCQPVTCWASLSDWRLWASLPVCSFFPSMFDAGSALWSRRGCVLSQAQGPAQADVRKGARMDALKDRTKAIKRAWFAWKQPNPCLPFGMLGLGGKSTSLTPALCKPFNLSSHSKDWFFSLASSLLMVRNRRGCLLLPFAAQVIEILISAGRTAGCYFCFI